MTIFVAPVVYDESERPHPTSVDVEGVEWTWEEFLLILQRVFLFVSVIEKFQFLPEFSRILPPTQSSWWKFEILTHGLLNKVNKVSSFHI